MKLISIQIAWVAKQRNIPILYYDQSLPDSQKSSTHFILDTLAKYLISKHRVTTVKKVVPGYLQIMIHHTFFHYL
jgi:hypothetical protein